MLWFNFILGLNVISLCFKLIIIHYHTKKQREIFKTKDKTEPQHISYIDLARAKSESLDNIYGLFKQKKNRVMLSGEGNENGEKTTIRSNRPFYSCGWKRGCG